MGMKTVLKAYSDLSSALTIKKGGAVTFENVNTSNNCIAVVSNETIQIKTKGLYRVSFNSTFVATSVGCQSVSLQANGADVDGASSSVTAVAVDDNVSLNFTTLVDVKEVCGGNGTFAELQVVNKHRSSFTVANLIIEKIA